MLNDKTKKLHTFCEHPEQENFESTYDILHNEVNEAQAAYMRIAEEAAAARYHFHQARHFYNKLSKQNRLITEFDQLLWYALVDHIKVISKDQIVVVFKDGTEI